MSLPERQSEYSEYSRADSYSQIDTLMCLTNMQALLAEARSLGALAVIGSDEVELDVAITEGSIRTTNLLGRTTMQFESVNFYSMEDDDVDAFRIRHNIETAVRGSRRQNLLSEYWLFYEKLKEDRMPVFNPDRSRYKISLDMIGSSESVRIMPNEGYPLQPNEHISFENSVKQYGEFNGFQFAQIEQLAIRAQDSVRAI